MTVCPGTWLTLFSEGRCPGQGVGVLIEASEERVVVEDVPEPILDFLEADVLTVEGVAEEVLTGVQAEGAAWPLSTPSPSRVRRGANWRRWIRHWWRVLSAALRPSPRILAPRAAFAVVMLASESPAGDLQSH